jgi:GNAT superfamily N-acetyltransferase
MDAYPMIIRTLTVFERDAVRNFYLALSTDDRRKRFCCTVSDESISKYVDGLNFTRHTILGAFNEHAQLIGLAELARGAEESEMAFSVRLDMRRQRIATKLMERLLLRARMRGIRKVNVMFLSDNTPVRRMAKRAGMLVETVGGEAYASRELLAPSAEELNRGFIEEAIAQSAYFSILGIERWGSLVNQSKSTAPQFRKTLDALTL